MNDPILQRLHEDLSGDLDRVLKRFKGTTFVTLVVRKPDLADGDVVIGNDDLDKTIEAINRMKNRPPTTPVA